MKWEYRSVYELYFADSGDEQELHENMIHTAVILSIGWFNY